MPAITKKKIKKAPVAVEKDEGSKCFKCGKEVNEDYLCAGCHAYICDQCDVNTNMPFGSHDKNLHLVENYLIMFDGKGKANIYTCEECKKQTITVDVDTGVTPYVITCRATEGCRGAATSAFYRVPPETAALARWEWYKPTGAEARQAGPYMEDHARKGGLFLRKKEG